MDDVGTGIMTQLAPVIVNSVVTILTALISLVGIMVVRFIATKRQQVVAAIGVDTYNHWLNVAKSVYFAVEQEFKGLKEKAVEKRQAFEREILKRIPSLTQADIDHLREAVVGEINEEIKRQNLFEPALSLGMIPLAGQNVSAGQNNLDDGISEAESGSAGPPGDEDQS